eukprot:6697674-Ditylum_brightwellii.AAC.1
MPPTSVILTRIWAPQWHRLLLKLKLLMNRSFMSMDIKLNHIMETAADLTLKSSNMHKSSYTVEWTSTESMDAKLSHKCRTALLHAKRKWPGIIISSLWPFCYKAVEKSHNTLDINSNVMSPLEVLLHHKEKIALEGYHT